MTKRLILGVNGQDGILLSRLLHSQNKRFIGVGIQDRPSVHTPKTMPYYALDIRDTTKVIDLIESQDVDVVYNLAGLSSVAQSFKDPQTTLEVNYEAVNSLLAKMFGNNNNSTKRFFQCSSSEMFGVAKKGLQSESAQFNPQSPYAEAKVKSHLVSRKYREDGFFVSCGILFNHESIFRPTTFVTRKVTSSVARIKLGLQENLIMGNLDATRDWGAASDYVDAINRIVEHDLADDFVIATGISHSVRDLVTFALRTVGLEDQFNALVHIDSNLLRKSEVKSTVGDASKIKRELDWSAKTSFEELISEMVEFDLEINAPKN